MTDSTPPESTPSTAVSQPSFKPYGIYHHYKGDQYLVLCLADTHNHNGDKDVVYLSLARGKYNTRPLFRDSRNEDSWTDVVEWPDGKRRTRFIHETHISEATLLSLQVARHLKKGLEGYVGVSSDPLARASLVNAAAALLPTPEFAEAFQMGVETLKRRASATGLPLEMVLDETLAEAAAKVPIAERMAASSAAYRSLPPPEGEESPLTPLTSVPLMGFARIAKAPPLDEEEKKENAT